MDFSNMHILITGASTGIGKCLCNILHEYGADVIGVYHNNKINNVTYDTYKCDITDELEVKELFNKIISRHEKIDVLVNCASLSIDEDIYEKSKDDFMKVVEVNLFGTFLMCKYASLNMHNGVIINMSSTDATDTYRTISIDYAASKAGIENMTKNLANRFPNIKICALAPNWVNTESVLEMDNTYLKEELKRIGQKNLINKEVVALKIIEMIINDEYISGQIVRLDDNDE